MRAKTGLFSVCLLSTLLRAMWRGILLALSIAAFRVLSEYPLLTINSVSFINCSSLYSDLEQILTILRHNEKGMFLVQEGGWHDVGRRYMFLSVSFLWRFVSILPFWILHETSRKGMEDCFEHWQLSASASLDGELWFMVNLIDL